jgi:hypothetical protein
LQLVLKMGFMVGPGFLVGPLDLHGLRLDEDTPSDKEWTLLSAHFSHVENLELDSGFNEWSGPASSLGPWIFTVIGEWGMGGTGRRIEV